MATGDEILVWKTEIEKQEPERRINCPICDWSLEEHNDILHCEFCGWTEK